jgi:hypothetical protein
MKTRTLIIEAIVYVHIGMYSEWLIAALPLTSPRVLLDWQLRRYPLVLPGSYYWVFLDNRDPSQGF